jgi:predicted HTH transcriptional regulator
LDGIQDCPRYYNFGIVGLEREAKLQKVSLDEYIIFITKKISISQLPDDLKTRVTKNITPITYDNMTVLMIAVDSGSSPVYYKDCLYAREGASCIEIKGSKQASIFELFK